MIEEARFSQELRDTITRHPDVHVRDLDTAAELIVFTVEFNIHRLSAFSETVAVEAVENELVDMVTRYPRGTDFSQH